MRRSEGKGGIVVPGFCVNRSYAIQHFPEGSGNGRPLNINKNNVA
jgi:hypothetical protein